MSVVCTKVYETKIEMAADSIVVRGWSKTTSGDFSKMLRINDMVIGSSGNCDEASLMWHYAKTHKPESATERDVLSFFAEFSRWRRENYGESSIGNRYILAYEGRVFRIEGYFVNEIKTYGAIGAGSDYANAAMHLGHSPKEAVKVACDLCCFVAEPILEEVMIKPKENNANKIA